MALAPSLTKGAESNLDTVSVICFSNIPKTELWIEALEENGAEMLEDTNTHTLQDITRQKLAVILDQNIPEKRIVNIIEKYEKICGQDPLMSLRFFCLKWDKEISNENDRLRIIDIKKAVLPAELPVRLNRALFKARLPMFLRTRYEVGISDTLKEINGISYRPITIQSYKKEGGQKILDYTTDGLFIHEKRLYSYHPYAKKMEEIGVNGRVFVTKDGSKIPAQMMDLAKLQDISVEE